MYANHILLIIIAFSSLRASSPPKVPLHLSCVSWACALLHFIGLAAYWGCLLEQEQLTTSYTIKTPFLPTTTNCLYFLREWRIPVTCRTCAADHHCCEFMGATAILSRRRHFTVLLRPLALTFFLSPLLYSQSLEGVDVDVPVRSDHSTMIYSQHLTSYESLCQGEGHAH